VRSLAGEIDDAAAMAAWEAACDSRWAGDPVWLHGDMAASNLLVRDGRLAAVIDFGCCAVGDPACDLTMAWTFFSGVSREAFREHLPFDDATWTRARGWALWKALITLEAARHLGGSDAASTTPFGWRHRAEDVIDALLAEQQALR